MVWPLNHEGNDMSVITPALNEEVKSKLLANLEKRLESYGSSRLRLFEYTKKHGDSFFDAPTTAATVSASAFTLLGSIAAAIPMGGGPAVLLGGVALATAGMFGTTAHYLINKIANPILKETVIRNFDVEKEVNRYIKTVNECLQENKNLSREDKADFIRELADSMYTKMEDRFKRQSMSGSYLDAKSSDNLYALRDKLQGAKIGFIENDFNSLPQPENKQSNQQGLMAKWVSRLTGKQEASAEIEHSRPGMRK